MKITEIVELNSGTPQFRITESSDSAASEYVFFGQAELDADLTGMDVLNANGKKIRTHDNVCTVIEGDVLFSLISGKATIVRTRHNEYLYTQNYVKLIPNSHIDACYLVYMINENEDIKRQLHVGQQGTVVLKYTIRQLNSLVFPTLPEIRKQRLIGSLYFNQLRIAALKIRLATTETKQIIEKLKKVK